MAQEFQARIVYRHSKVICLKKESSKIIFQIVARSLRVKPFCNPNLFQVDSNCIFPFIISSIY